MYTILKRTIIGKEVIELIASQKKELDKRLADHKAGKLKYYTIDEVRKAVYVILNEKSKDYDYNLSDDDKKELDDLDKQNKAGKLKSVTLAQIRKETYTC